MGDRHWLDLKASVSQVISTCVSLILATRALCQKRLCLPHWTWRKNLQVSKQVSHFHTTGSQPELWKQALSAVFQQAAAECAWVHSTPIERQHSTGRSALQLCVKLPSCWGLDSWPRCSAKGSSSRQASLGLKCDGNPKRRRGTQSTKFVSFPPLFHQELT